jgi:hypothetical protein
MTPVDQVLSALDRVKPNGSNKWMACCPAHNDRSPSLSITEADGGKVLLHCFAGCDTRDVVSAMGLQMADLYPEGLTLEAKLKHERKSLEAARDHAQRLLAIAQANAESLDGEDLLVAAKAELDLPRIESRLAEIAAPAPALTAVQLSDVMSATLEPVRFALKPWLPRRHVTLFGGHGGIGKSSLALAMGAHVAAGLPFAGHEVDRLPVLFVSLEDEPSIVRLRLRRIIESYRLDAGEVLPCMSLLDGTQAFSALMTEGDGFNAPPQFTQAFRELAEQAQGAGLIIVDNASDAFDANENSRRAVRAFVRGLAAIARKNNAAVVLLAHIDKAAARNGGQGNSYSGSTAWHNSARSRLALTEQDGAIVLEHEKANLSKLAEPLRLAFTDGVLMPEAGTGGAMLTSEHFDQAEIIRALHAATEAGINVPASLTPGAHCAMKALEPLPEYGQAFKGKAGSRRAAAALVKLRRDGRVREESYPGPHRKTKTRLVIVEGSAQNDEQGAGDEV